MNDNKLDINNLPELLIISEVAELFRVTPLTLKRWEKKGTIKCFRINERGDRRYKKEVIIKKLEELEFYS